MRKGVSPLFLACLFALIATFALPAVAGASEGESGNSEPHAGEVVCLAIGHCPDPPRPHPPYCEDGAEVCIPPMPPWCDEAGNCEPPRCDPSEDNPKFCRPLPEDPTVCVLGWPSEEPMPECHPVIVDPPFCSEDGSEADDEGTVEPGVHYNASDSSSNSDETSEDPLPCDEPPFYGCRETEEGPIICVDPPVDWCEVAGSKEIEVEETMIACLRPDPPEEPMALDKDSVKRELKAKRARAKARVKAKAARAKARKAKAAKAKKAKAQELKRR